MELHIIFGIAIDAAAFAAVFIYMPLANYYNKKP